VIFNPTARGEKARRFRRHLDEIGAECALKQTTFAGGARPLAAEAIHEGFELVVAAGGDGTLNEVLNGIGDVPGGFERICLGVLPLGTVNVFAKELGLPSDLHRAWRTLRQGREDQIDLPQVTCAMNGVNEHRYFAQLAGAGLDARAIELVDWQLKKKLGPLAYGKKDEAIFLGREIAQHRDYSEDTAIQIDKEVKRIVNGGYENAKNLLSKNRETLERIAQALLEREVIDANEVKLLMEGKPLPEKPRTPPTTPQAAPSADPKVVRPELRPAPGFTRGENPAKA